MRKFFKMLGVFALLIFIAALFTFPGCTMQDPVPVADTGIKKATAEVETDISGLTVEQKNVKSRLEKDNQVGSIKHLYVISAYTGQVLIYSTVDGKVTSSGKRLTPTSVAAMDGQYVGGAFAGMPVEIGGHTFRTTEVLQDDGTYGHSAPYLFWFDTQGNYHQHWVAGGQILHISDEPLAVKDVVIRIGSVDE